MCQSNEDSPECHSGKDRLQTLSPGGDRSDTPAAVRPVMCFSVSWSTETIFGVAQIISVDLIVTHFYLKETSGRTMASHLWWR